MQAQPNPENDWQRIAELRPRLVGESVWHCHCYRGHDWQILEDRVTGRHFHFTPDAARLVRSLDGATRIGDALEAIAPVGVTQDEVIALLTRLQEADLLDFGVPRSPLAQYQRWRRKQHQTMLGPLLRPLSVRLALFDPTRMLDVLLPVFGWLFSRKGLVIWLLLTLWASATGLRHSDALFAHGSSRLLDPFNLLLLWAGYPVIKLLHELGHGLAIRRWGGTVRELGVIFLVFMPVPYVDGSAATGFPEKRRRMIVGAAGIMVEIALAALGLFVWLHVQPGLVRDIAFNTMTIAGVSTLLFNGNPLLRFDGYYVFADAVEIPNLAPRSRQYYLYLLKRYLLGLRNVASPVLASGERGWFLCYGAASTAYRLGISLVIALYLAGRFFVIGLGLAVLVLITALLLPAFKAVRYLFGSAELAGNRWRAGLAATFGLGLVGGLLLAFPVPSNTVAHGVILAPEGSLLRTAATGEIVELLHGHGDVVAQGEPLLVLADVELDAQAAVLAARADELIARIERATLSDRVEAAILRDQLASVRAEQLEVARRRDHLIMESPMTGMLDLPRARDLPGRFIQQGQVLGSIRARGKSTARVVIPQEEADRVRRATRSVTAEVEGYPSANVLPEQLQEVPAGTRILPSAVLGSMGGGQIAVDTRDESGVTAIAPVFHFEIPLPETDVPYFPGTRVMVRFRHPAEPLAISVYRRLQQVLLPVLGV